MTAEELLTAPFATVSDLVAAHARERGGQRALLHDERAMTYAALDRAMDRVATALVRDGVRPRESIAICAGTSIEYAVVYLGALRAGVAVAPLAPSSTVDGLVSMIDDCGARLLFLDATVAGQLAPAMAKIRVPRIALDVPLDVPLDVAPDRPPGNAANAPAGAAPADTGRSPHGKALPDWLGSTAPSAAFAPIDPDGPFNIIYSSGTTGTPNGIVQSHAMRWQHVQRAGVYGYNTQTITLLATPLYSNTTLVAFFPTIARGGCAVLMGKFDAAGYLALAERHRATHTMLVPVQYQRVMAVPDFGRYDLSSFRMKQCTSAPFAARLKADILARWPGGLVEVYGMTEGGGTCILPAHEFPHKLHTVGRPAPGHDIRLIDELDRELPRGETGEIVGHSPATMTGYHGRPDKTREAEWFDATGRRFIRTGDVGRFDDDGFLTLLDRRKDMIISGGFNIYPSDLEAVLRTSADVADVAVVGVPSEKWGETPVAFVVARDGASVDPDALLAWANGQLGKMQRIAAIELIDELPRSAIGKVLKRELRDRYVPRAGR